MQVIWTPTARDDVVGIQVFIAEFDPQAADRMVQTVVSAGNALETFPNRGRPTDIADIRELVVPGTAYLLVYRVTEKAVQILRVWHGAQDRA